MRPLFLLKNALKASFLATSLILPDCATVIDVLPKGIL